MLSAKSAQLLAAVASNYLEEVVEPHAGLIKLAGNSPRLMAREIEDAISEAMRFADAMRKREAELAAAKPKEPAAPPAPKPEEPKAPADPDPDPVTNPGAYNRKRISEGIEEAATAGAPNV